MAEDLTNNQRLMSVNDLMQKLESDNEKLISGELKETQARILAKNRSTQAKLMELELQAGRMDAKIRNGLIRRYGALIDVTPIRPALGTGEPKAEEKPEAKPSEGT